MVQEDLIHEDDKAAIMRALLLRHRHVNEHSHGAFHFGARRKYSSYSSLQVIYYNFVLIITGFIFIESPQISTFDLITSPTNFI